MILYSTNVISVRVIFCGDFIIFFILVFYIFGVLLIKQLFQSPLMDI